MNELREMKSLLFEELELIVRTSSNLIRKIEPAHWNHKPADNMRSLAELARHLVGVPSVDLLILKEKSREEVAEWEAVIDADGVDPDKLIGSMTAGLAELKRYMEELSDEDFLHKKTKPFYVEHRTAQAKWLIEIVTHAQHHRAQLFNYMKALGYDINMFDLY
ncbi:DinB family protein [Paenibacillaceae bacterium WGS1546]|uniref:DinB family protein n=1 Tax=Cohnella sp. WGS1546 TaxID=3366810 RepID=UPI00372D6AA2